MDSILKNIEFFKFNKKRGKATPAISTASLPDIIFILLFFFMVVTVMRETTLKVKVSLPKATELTKLEKKSLVSYIYIGEPTRIWRSIYGTAPVVQLNDQIATPEQVVQFIINEREKTDEKLHKFMTTSLRVDKEAKMGIVSEVKQQLREVDALKINYSAIQDSKK